MEAWKLLGLFSIVLAGLCEIGGGYLICYGYRDGGAFWVAFLGAVILVAYGVVATSNQLILADYTLPMVVFSL